MKNARPASLITHLFFCTLFSLTASAQSIAPDVLASAGGSDSIQLQWTLGELAIATYDNTQNILTEGFHQTLLVLPPDPVGVNDAGNLSVRIYPNPTTESITIELERNSTQWQARLYDLQGRLLQNTPMYQESRCRVDMHDLPSASYLLKVFTLQDKLISTHTIQKINSH